MISHISSRLKRAHGPYGVVFVWQLILVGGLDARLRNCSLRTHSGERGDTEFSNSPSGVTSVNGEDTQRMEPTPNDPTLHSLTPFDSFASIYETILGRSDFRVFLMSGWRCGRTVKSTRYYESCDVQIALQMHGRTNTEHEHGQATLTQLMAALIAGCPLGRVWATGGLYWCVRRERL